MKFEKKSPCQNCPYRTDAPLALWDKIEFERLLSQDEQWGGVYGCHKKDDNVCVGWLMKQREDRLPNINLRLLLTKKDISYRYIESLHCKVPLFSTVKEMIYANFPELINDGNDME